MFPRIALATLLIGCLAHSANAQKDKPKPTKPADLLTWETVAADKAGKMTTKRAHVPNGWLILVQNGDDMVLTFVPDADHRWDDKSPSDANPPKPKIDDLTKAAGDKLKIDLEQARATAVAERDRAVAALKKAEVEAANWRESQKALGIVREARQEADKQRAMAEAQRKEAQAAQKKAEDELKKALDQLEKAKNDKKPKKGDKGAAATETERQRIAEALGLAARDESQKAKALADQARAAAAAERERAEAVQKRLAGTMIDLEEARKAMRIAQASAADCRRGAEVARREALVLKETLGAVAKEFQKKLADTTKALEEARAAEKRAAVEAAAAQGDNQRLKAELDLAKKENDRLRQLLDKKKEIARDREHRRAASSSMRTNDQTDR